MLAGFVVILTARLWLSARLKMLAGPSQSQGPRFPAKSFDFPLHFGDLSHANIRLPHLPSRLSTRPMRAVLPVHTFAASMLEISRALARASHLSTIGPFVQKDGDF